MSRRFFFSLFFYFRPKGVESDSERERRRGAGTLPPLINHDVAHSCEPSCRPWGGSGCRCCSVEGEGDAGSASTAVGVVADVDDNEPSTPSPSSFCVASARLAHRIIRSQRGVRFFGLCGAVSDLAEWSYLNSRRYKSNAVFLLEKGAPRPPLTSTSSLSFFFLFLTSQQQQKQAARHRRLLPRAR